MNDISPENPTPTPPATGDKPANWLSENFMPLLFVAGVAALIAWRGLYVADVALAALGLGLVIFLHELGHFMAAKFCDVHVETFSIGFGKAIPGCQFRYGETTYKLGWIPLGGYVKMVGEGDNADSDEAEEDPRSFKNKGVYQRMLIISAGVIMNLILGFTCFIVAYSHGVEEPPGIIGFVGAGSPAWQSGLRSDLAVLKIASIEKPTYLDIRTKVMSSSEGDRIMLETQNRKGEIELVEVSPKRDKELGELFPTIGIGQTGQLSLVNSPRTQEVRAARVNSAAAGAKDASGVGFMPGDKIVASTDPDNPAAVKDLPLDSRDPTGKKLDFFEFRERLQLLRDKTITVTANRNGQRVDVQVEPERTRVFPGVRFQIGRIVALRNNSPATRAKPADGGTEPGLLPVNPAVADSGDRLIAVEITQPDGTRHRYTETPDMKTDDKIEESILDPLRLPYDLDVWAEQWIRHGKAGAAGAKFPPVRMTVMRSPADASQKTARRQVFDLEWDVSFRFTHEISFGNAPLSLPSLGIAYQVSTTVDDVAKGSPAEAAGLQKSDVIVGFRPKYMTPKNEVKDNDWLDLKRNQGGHLFASIQQLDLPEIALRVDRSGEKRELTLNTEPVNDWFQTERGFVFESDTRTQKAGDFWEAIQFSGQRTVRMIRTIYQQLYALVSGSISVKSMNGPLSIANISYKIVGNDMWTFIVFIGMISLNLAVVNFLPIPVLDGGHMVFLIYEKIRGKPAPEKIMEWSLYIGLGLIFSLMFFVIYLDVKRLFL